MTRPPEKGSNRPAPAGALPHRHPRLCAEPPLLQTAFGSSGAATILDPGSGIRDSVGRISRRDSTERIIKNIPGGGVLLEFDFDFDLDLDLDFDFVRVVAVTVFDAGRLRSRAKVRTIDGSGPLVLFLVLGLAFDFSKVVPKGFVGMLQRARSRCRCCCS
jgi:hypothetical protein